MSRRVNKRGWIVLVSIPSDDGGFCVDIFELPGAGFGHQHFRTDAEDQGAWTPIGGASTSFDTPTEAAASAVAAVPWLTAHHSARRALEDWLQTLGSTAPPRHLD